MAANMPLVCSGDEESHIGVIQDPIIPTIMHELSRANDVFSVGDVQCYDDSQHQHQNDSNDVVYVVVEKNDVKRKPLTKKNPKDFYYTCQVCWQKFANKSQITLHAKTHKGHHIRKLYRCKECNNSFTALNQLKQHEKVHTGVKPYKCPICPKTFKQMSHVRNHVKTHPSTHSFQCPYGNCKKTFTFFHKLKNHEEDHMDELHLDGLYKCNWLDCERTFMECSNLEIHVNNHKAGSAIHHDNNNIPSHDDNQQLKTQTCEIGITDDHIELNDDDEEEEEDDEDKYDYGEGRKMEDGVITPLMCNICFSVYSKESSYNRHVEECREKQKLAEENGCDLELSEDGEEEDDMENIISKESNSLISLFPSDYTDYSGGGGGGSGGSSQMQYINHQANIGIASLMGNSSQHLGAQATSEEATPSSNCIDNMGDQKFMCEGQRFLRFLLQENRRHLKRQRCDPR